ncbi:MAG: sulfurtransferase [Chloroflexi bacterium]|nr:sulfurtransferase [Chloroflexota bacterium]
MQRDAVLIEAEELLDKLGDPTLRIFDTSMVFFAEAEDAPSRYLKGHIPGAAFFDHARVTDQEAKYPYTVAPEAQLAREIGAMGIGNAHQVVVYTTELIAAATRAWWILRYAGHQNVRVLNGGLAAWQKAGGAIEQGEHTYPPAEFTPTFKPEMFASKEEVQAAIEDGAVCTVFTLSEDAFPQMIAGSTRNDMDNLLVEDRFLSNADLSARLKDEAAHERVITYCGGGIAATANAVAHLLAGNENVSVYDGSLYEWTGEGLPTG